MALNQELVIMHAVYVCRIKTAIKICGGATVTNSLWYKCKGIQHKRILYTKIIFDPMAKFMIPKHTHTQKPCLLFIVCCLYDKNRVNMYIVVQVQ